MGRGRSKRKAYQNTTAAVTITDLPNPIICDILSRLPLDSIYTCKRVCKIWHSHILEPYFAKLHLSRSPLSLISYNDCIDPDSNSASSHFKILELHDPPVTDRCIPSMKLPTEIYSPYMAINIVASCNGSILLSNLWSSEDLVIVCNPLRAQHVVLPKPPKLVGPRQMWIVTFGLGHSPATDLYKVLRLTRTYIQATLYCDIYTIGIDDEWRRIGDIGQPPAHIDSEFIFLNGALHCMEFENARFIYSFDIEKEQFKSFPLPSHFGDGYDFLGVVDNRLCIYNEYSVGGWKIWSMNEYGDFGSWRLEWVIQRPIALGWVIEGSTIDGFNECFKPLKMLNFKPLNFKPLKMLKDGSLLIMFSNSRSRIGEKITTLASYNPQTGGMKTIKYRGKLPWSNLVADVPCFFSPVDALK